MSASSLSKKQLILFIIIFLCFSKVLLAAKWRVRAREHFDTVNVQYKDAGQEENTSGIGPTINVWWEEPYKNSIGFAIGLMYIDFDKKSETLGRAERMELWKYGVEGKHYAAQEKGGAFLRWGLSRNQLKTEGTLGTLTGNGAYLGVGWEFPFDILGLAFELAQRQVDLEDTIFINSFSPSIGVHFYKHL